MLLDYLMADVDVEDYLMADVDVEDFLMVDDVV